MNYLPLQIIVTLFVFVIVWRLGKKYKDNTLRIYDFLIWLAIWVAVLIVFWLPQTTSYLAVLLGIGRGSDLAVYLAVLFMFYLIFRIYLKIDKQQRDITKIARHLALTEHKDKDD